MPLDDSTISSPIPRLTPVRAADSLASVARSATWGAGWIFLATLISRALSFGTDLILARLLSPAEFGVVSFALILIGAFTILQDLGVPAAVVYSKRDVAEVSGTALTVNVASASLLFVVTALASPFLATFGHSSVIAPMATVLALQLVISSFGSVHGAVLSKDLAFGRKFLPNSVPTLVQGGVSIGLAFLGFGAWSLVIGYIVRALSSTVLLWCVSSLRPSLTFHWHIAVDLVRYGSHVSLNSVVGFAALNVDYFIIGHFLGTANLGIYTLAFTIASLPSVAIGQSVASVSFPAYLRLRNDFNALFRLLTGVLSIVAALSVLTGILIYIGTPAFSSIVLTHRWVAIVTPLQVLVPFGVLTSIGILFPSAYKAIGRPDVLWKTSLLKLVLLTSLMMLLLPHGIVGIAVAHDIAAAIFLPLNVAILVYLMKVPFARLWATISPTLTGIVLVAPVLVLVEVVPGLRVASHSPFGAVALATVVAVLYAIVVVKLDPGIIGYGQSILLPILGNRQQTAAK